MLSLAKLQRDGWRIVKGQHDAEDVFAKWMKEMCAKSPTFENWDLILCLEQLVLIFDRSYHERNIALYIEILEILIPWFFVLDHSNYARWIAVHVRDMKAIHALIRDEFQLFSVFPKIRKKFSAMSLDHAHEQNNA